MARRQIPFALVSGRPAALGAPGVCNELVTAPVDAAIEHAHRVAVFGDREHDRDTVQHIDQHAGLLQHVERIRLARRSR